LEANFSYFAKIIWMPSWFAKLLELLLQHAKQSARSRPVGRPPDILAASGMQRRSGAVTGTGASSPPLCNARASDEQTPPATAPSPLPSAHGRRPQHRAVGPAVSGHCGIPVGSRVVVRTRKLVGGSHGALAAEIAGGSAILPVAAVSPVSPWIFLFNPLIWIGTTYCDPDIYIYPLFVGMNVVRILSVRLTDRKCHRLKW
jgi:hypothetical protein